MKKKIITIVLILVCLSVGILIAVNQFPALQSDKQDDKITEEVSDDEKKSDETEKTEGTNEVEGIEIPFESDTEDEESQTSPDDGTSDDNVSDDNMPDDNVSDDNIPDDTSDDDGDVELPAVPIQ